MIWKEKNCKFTYRSFKNVHSDQACPSLPFPLHTSSLGIVRDPLLKYLLSLGPPGVGLALDAHVPRPCLGALATEPQSEKMQIPQAIGHAHVTPALQF